MTLQGTWLLSEIEPYFLEKTKGDMTNWKLINLKEIFPSWLTDNYYNLIRMYLSNVNILRFWLRTPKRLWQQYTHKQPGQRYTVSPWSGPCSWFHVRPCGHHAFVVQEWIWGIVSVTINLHLLALSVTDIRGTSGLWTIAVQAIRDELQSA